MEFFHRPEDPTNLPGYWGQRTSAVDWCESNYQWSHYIAEFFNTITSLPAAFLAFYSMYLTYKYGYDKRFYLVNSLVAMVGIGSAAFHGTLLYTGQILDELPMVYTCTALLYTVMELESTDKKAVNKYLAPFLIGFLTVFTGVYLYLPDFFIFFLVGFILGVLTLVYQCSKIFRKPTTVFHQKVCIMAAVCFYIGGWLFFWIPEVLFCDNLKSFNFHALWHVTSTLGCTVMVLFMIFQRELHRGRNPQMNYNCLLGVPMLPFVHIPSSMEQKLMDEVKLPVKEIKEEKESESTHLEEQRRKLKKKKSMMSSVSTR